MSDTATLPNRAKKGVGLSGVTAGNTALCTVGRTGNDLHYRGYDILDVAETCEFEEIAYLLVHGALPNRAELAGYKAKLRSLRGIPASLKQALEALPPASHPMDVMRTAVSALGCSDDHSAAMGRNSLGYVLEVHLNLVLADLKPSRKPSRIPGTFPEEVHHFLPECRIGWVVHREKMRNSILRPQQ